MGEVALRTISVCDVDRNMFKKKQQKIINFIAFIIFDIKNTYLTYEK